MQRREALTVLGASSFAASTGCLGVLLGTDCNPGNPTLATLYERVLEMENPGNVSVQGTITTMESLSMIISDGTGYAEVNPPYGKKFNDGWFEVGECVRVDGSVKADYSREFGFLSLDLGSGEDIETQGDTNDPPDPPPTEPDVSFDLSFQGPNGVELKHTGSDPVPASHLEVRSRPSDNLRIYPWEDFADEAAENSVAPGDTAVFDEADSGRLIWRPGQYWGDSVSSGW